MHTLKNQTGTQLRVSEIGASIVGLLVPDRHGRLADIVLGYDDESAYRRNPFYFGSIVGRCANRIADGEFQIDGRKITLERNNGRHHLHGGSDGFSGREWVANTLKDERGEAIRFTLTSPDGDQGYPGVLEASVAYVLTEQNELICEMRATTDAPTLCNLAQHAYWNLAGHDSGTIAGHELTLCADMRTPADETGAPTGAIDPVASTPYDFRSPKQIGVELESVGSEPHGYDTNFVIRGEPGSLRHVARVSEPNTGRVMTIDSDQPGVQLYTANCLDGSEVGKDGAAYSRHGGLCLETQCFPDAINQPEWHSPALRPGQIYRHTIVYRFSAEN